MALIDKDKLIYVECVKKIDKDIDECLNKINKWSDKALKEPEDSEQRKVYVDEVVAQIKLMTINLKSKDLIFSIKSTALKKEDKG